MENIALSRAKDKHWVGGVPLSKLFSRVSKSIFFQCIIQLAVPLPKQYNNVSFHHSIHKNTMRTFVKCFAKIKTIYLRYSINFQIVLKCGYKILKTNQASSFQNYGEFLVHAGAQGPSERMGSISPRSLR